MFRLRAKDASQAIAPGFVGLGYEIPFVARTGLLSAANFVYVNLVRTLGSKGVIRIGGNTADYARYEPNASAVSSPYRTVVNDVLLNDLGGFLQATGWKLIWTLNLGSGSIENAIAEAVRVQAPAGVNLLAFEIGNEPDLFVHEKHRSASYSYDQWLAEYRQFKLALRAKLPGVAFARPDVAGATGWVTRFAKDEGADLAVLTHHYYRDGQGPGNSIAQLLGPDPKLPVQLEALREASQQSGVPYRICEVNSFSGGGRPGTSDTMAAALWVLDYMFTLASYGCSGVNMETGVNQLGFVSSYSPVGDDEQGKYFARPEYYGMLAFSLSGKGELLAVESVISSSSAKVYATRQADGSVTLTLINKSGINVTSQVEMDQAMLPRGLRSQDASLIHLRGPAIDAKNGVTLGGAEVTRTGKRAASMTERVVLEHGRLHVKVAAWSACLVFIG